MTEARDAPLDVLIVASWFPSVDDPAAGRFVADQAEALISAGVTHPRVISFDIARLTGGATSRGRQASTVMAATSAALGRATPLFAAPAWGVDPAVPVARLSTPEGKTSAAGPAHAAAHRETVLLSLVEQLARADPSPELMRKVDSADGFRAPAGGVVHAHTGYPDGAAAVALADRLGWPLIVTEHSSFVDRLIAEPVLHERYERMLRRAHRLFAVSRMLATELSAAFPEHVSKIEVMPNAVPMDLFSPTGLADRHADELLFVGYRKASKGIETLLRATAIAQAARPAVRLRLVGRASSEAEESTWRNLAAELGISDAVDFDTARDRSGVVEALGRASIFVHPSPRETFGVVAVEALATGTPVVATDSGGVTEILGAEPDRLGALVAAGDVDALGAAIVSTLERCEAFDPAELRASVERRFGAAFVAERLYVAYREALARALPLSSTIMTIGGPSVGRLEPVEQAIVVALDREEAARRLGALPDAARRSLIVLTATQPARFALPAVGRLVEVVIDQAWRPGVPPGRQARRGLAGRLARLARDPLGTIRRRFGLDAGSDRSLRPATEALRDLAKHLPGMEIVTVDGHDAVAAEPILTAHPERRSGGGLRRLADSWSTLPD